MIRRAKGWERMMIHLTGKRKYTCVSCGHVFRAPDRRRVPREQDEAVLRNARTNELRS
jgi:hypothetical protein